MKLVTAGISNESVCAASMQRCVVDCSIVNNYLSSALSKSSRFWVNQVIHCSLLFFPPQRQHTRKRECTLTPSVVWKRDGEMFCLTHGIRWKECTTAGQHVKEGKKRREREKEKEGVKAETADGGWVAYLCHYFHILVL